VQAVHVMHCVQAVQTLPRTQTLILTQT